MPVPSNVARSHEHRHGQEQPPPEGCASKGVHFGCIHGRRVRSTAHSPSRQYSVLAHFACTPRVEAAESTVRDGEQTARAHTLARVLPARGVFSSPCTRHPVDHSSAPAMSSLGSKVRAEGTHSHSHTQAMQQYVLCDER